MKRTPKELWNVKCCNKCKFSKIINFGERYCTLHCTKPVQVVLNTHIGDSSIIYEVIREFCDKHYCDEFKEKDKE